jgi:hypothetical protein
MSDTEEEKDRTGSMHVEQIILRMMAINISTRFYFWQQQQQQQQQLQQ